MADALKAEGNKLFAEKKFEESIEKFTQAIELDPTNHVLYSNRSGSYASLKDFDKALEDATKTTELKADWAKGWNRKGSALHGKGELDDASVAFNKALEIDPANAQAKSGLAAVQRAIESEADAGEGGLGQMFNDPNLMTKLANNPKTASLLGDAEFMGKLQALKSNPKNVGTFMQDPRALQVMSVLLGLDMQFGAPGDIPGEQSDSPMPDATPAPKETPRQQEPEPEPEDEETIANREAKAKADEEKKLGTEFYKKRQFDQAIEHYGKAWEIHKDIVYLTNSAAAKYEKADYDGAIEDCQKAVDYGREVFADFKQVAKAFGRMGSAYEKKGDLTNAIEYYQRSLTEHRGPDILAKLRAAEKAKLTSEKEAYLSPEKAEEARELGNQKFKDADWPGAVEAYSEMIKRAPDDARGYSNRAACFIKLLTFPSAVQDCDEAIKRDIGFIRAYLRKAQALFAMKEYNRCLDVCTEAAEHDKDGKNARELEAQSQKALQAQFTSREGETEEETMARIQKDPDIVGILQDPVMQSILQQAKGDPAALQEHMRNPGIRSKVQKLIAAGVIRMGR